MTTYHPDTPENLSNGHREKSRTEAVRDQLEAGKEQALGAVENARVQASDTVGRASDQSAQFIRENPGLALGGAVAFGILLGMAMRGRD